MLASLDDQKGSEDRRGHAHNAVSCTPDPAPYAYLIEHEQVVKQPDSVSPNSAHLSPINPDQLNDLLTQF